MRKVLRPITLATPDGRPLPLPAGTICVTPETATHHDPENYANPDTFDPWRFADLRAEKGESGTGGLKHQFVSTSPSYISFGLGKHAWCVLHSVLSLCVSIH